MRAGKSNENDLMTRLHRLYLSITPKPMTADEKKHQRSNLPLSHRKIDLNRSNHSIDYYQEPSYYEKYSKIWIKPSISPIAFKYFSILALKLRQKRLSRSFYKLYTHSTDPLAFTKCPKCEHIGLSLLTTSTQGNFSPKFLSKLSKILPKPRKTQIIPSTPADSCRRLQLETTPKRNDKRSISSSLVMYSDEKVNSDKKNPISDLSDIQPNNFFLSSLSSPEQFHKTFEENRICKPKAEVSFEVSKESWDVFRQSSGFGELPKSSSKIPAIENHKNNYVGLAMIVKKIFNARTQIVFNALNSNDIRKRLEKPIVSNTLKTAYKILHSRLEKFFYRRKMQGFYSISELLYI